MDLLSLPAEMFEDAARVTLSALAGYVRSLLPVVRIAHVCSASLALRSWHTSMSMASVHIFAAPGQNWVTQTPLGFVQGVNLPSGIEAAGAGEQTAQDLTEFAQLQQAVEARCFFGRPADAHLPWHRLDSPALVRALSKGRPGL